MQQPHRRIERNNERNVVEPAGENVSGEDLLQMFGALRRPVDQQNGCRRGNDVDNADQRLLWDPRPPAPRECQQHSGEQREGERIAVGRDALGRMAEHEGDGRTQRRDLGQRQIDEDHFAGQYLNAEIGVDADQAHRHQKRRPEKLQRIDHRIAAAAVSASTFASNSEM